MSEEKSQKYVLGCVDYFMGVVLSSRRCSPISAEVSMFDAKRRIV